MCVCNHVYARYLSTLIVGTRSIFAFVVGVKLIARDCAIFRFICMTAKRLWLAPRSFTSTYWLCMYITCTLTPYIHTHTHIFKYFFFFSILIFCLFCLRRWHKSQTLYFALISSNCFVVVIIFAVAAILLAYDSPVCVCVSLLFLFCFYSHCNLNINLY